MKENNGKGASERFWKQISGVLSVTLFVLGLISVWDVRSSNRGRIRKKQRVTLLGGLRQRESSSAEEQLLHPQHQHQQQQHQRQDTSKILDGSFTLIDIMITSTSAPGLKKKEGSNTYTGVYGVFCPVQWGLHHANPSQYPMFRDLIEASECSRKSVRLDLASVASEARNLDRNDAATTKVLPLGGVVFHESRCGSTLVANSLVASHPDQHRVYSESSPPVEALQFCHDGREKEAEDPTDVSILCRHLLADVIYLMSRTSDPSTTCVFFKIQSIGTVNIQKFTKVFPNIPWVFVFRDPVEVMMSHLPSSINNKDNILFSNCLRTFHRPNPYYHSLIRKFTPTKTFDTLSYEQHCAAHLAQITEAARAAMENDNNSKGMLVHYGSDLSQNLIQTVFPHHFSIPMDIDAVKRVQDVSTLYSKGRGKRAGEWRADSAQKLSSASPAIIEASNLFLLDTYNWMKERSIHSLQ
jgi:hypothetical protein